MDNGTNSLEIPKYKCHKVVHALQINSVEINPDREVRGILLHFTDEKYAPIREDMGFQVKHDPTAGDYYVVYEDGYKSISPAKAFEDGYRKIGGKIFQDLAADDVLFGFVGWMVGMGGAADLVRDFRKKLISLPSSDKELLTKFIEWLDALPERHRLTDNLGTMDEATALVASFCGQTVTDRRRALRK